MKLGETPLKCYECRKTSDFEEVEIVTRDGKRFWVCPHCDMETEIVEKIFPPEGASAYKCKLVDENSNSEKGRE